MRVWVAGILVGFALTVCEVTVSAAPSTDEVNCAIFQSRKMANTGNYFEAVQLCRRILTLNPDPISKLKLYASIITLTSEYKAHDRAVAEHRVRVETQRQLSREAQWQLLKQEAMDQNQALEALRAVCHGLRLSSNECENCREALLSNRFELEGRLKALRGISADRTSGESEEGSGQER